MRTVVVGCGPRGREHAEGAAALEDVELVGVADLDERRTSALSSELGVASAPLTELLTDASPDLLVLAVPPSGRVELVEQAVEAGARGILVEKPFALSLADAERMHVLCEERGVALAVCHQLRFVPGYVALREAVAAGELGEVQLVQAAAFGNLLDQGPHLVDAARWLAGDRRVLWAMSQRGDGATATLPAERVPPAGEAHPAPPFMTSHLALEGGARAVVETGALYQRPEGFRDEWLAKRVTVVGSEGVGQAVASGGGKITTPSGTRELNGDVDAYMGATAAVLADLRDAVRDDRPPLCDAGEALRSLEAVLACAQSAVDGDAALLPLDPERDPVGELSGAPCARAGAAPRPRVNAALEASVIVPLPDHRGYAIECVEGWLAQSVADERYQLVVMSDGSEPGLEERVRGLLRDGDRLIVEPGAHETRLYHLGAESASADLFVFTEPHCVPEPRALDELMRFMAGSDYDGACLRSVGVSKSAMARMEERYFDAGFEEWSKEEHWCKVILRGFAVRREAYDAAGGFDWRYQRFAEFALGATLHDKGKRLGYAAGATVRHANATSLRYNKGAIVDFAEGEAAYWREQDPAFCRRYFGESPEAGERHALDAGAARSACLSALRSLSRRSVWRDAAARSGMAAALRRHAPAAVLGPAPRLARARASLASAHARTYLWRLDEDRLLEAFVDGWDRRGALTRLHYVAAHAGDPPPLEPAQRFEIDEIPEERLLGFHAREQLDGRGYRWSRGLASLDLPMDAPPTIRLETVPARSGKAPLIPWVYLGRRRVPHRAIEASEDGLTIDLSATRLRPRGEQRLTITCAPLTSEWVPSEDPRELGLPLAAVELR